MSDLIISFDGDGIGRRVGRATLSDDIEEVRRINQAIDAGNAVFSKWALACGGSVIEVGGDEGRLQVPARFLDELPDQRRLYAERVGASVSVGVGWKLSESAKALLASKLRGKDRITFYGPGIEEELKEAEKEKPNEVTKLVDEYLSPVAKAEVIKPDAQPPEHSEAEVARGVVDEEQPPAPEGTHAASDFNDSLEELRGHADKGDQAEATRKEHDVSREQAAKEQAAQALLSVKKVMPVLQQLQRASPEVYGAVTGLARAVVELGRAAGYGRGVQKGEVDVRFAELSKADIRYKSSVKEAPRPPKGFVDRFDHVLEHVRQNDPHASSGFRGAEKFGVRQIRPEDYYWPEAPLQLDVNHPDIDSRDPASPYDVKTYEGWMRGGSEPPAVFGIYNNKGNFVSILDGAHRLAAKQAAGQDNIGAYLGLPKVLAGKGHWIEKLATKKKAPVKKELKKSDDSDRRNELERIAEEYGQRSGIPYARPPATSTDEALLGRVAASYEAAKHEPNDPRVKASYGALKRETLAQYKLLQEKGYHFTGSPTASLTPSTFDPEQVDARFVNAGEQPYQTFRELYDDLYKNKHLHTFVGGDLPSDHPLAEAVPGGGPLLTYNDVFRAVHDVFGHGKEGVDFGHHGEDRAWQSHAAMYSPEARGALTTETRGQNTAFHFGKMGAHNRANPAQAVYPDQKATLLPDEFSKPAAPSAGLEKTELQKEQMDLDLKVPNSPPKEPGYAETHTGTPEDVELHPDPRGAKVVYRVQDAEGKGPYQAGAPVYQTALGRNNYTNGGGTSEHGTVGSSTGGHQPGPGNDFGKEWYNFPDAERKKLHFGFESPAHAREWFGVPALDDMKRQGFELTPVKAKQVWRSKSRRQLVFLPHESETKLQKGEGDVWDKDTGKLREHAPKSLDKALPMPNPKMKRVILPPGSQIDDRIKVAHSSGGASWRQVRSGIVMSTDPSQHPASSRNPSAK